MRLRRRTLTSALAGGTSPARSRLSSPPVVALVVVVLNVLADKEPQVAFAELLAKDPVFLSQIVDLVLLTTIESIDHDQNDELLCKGHPPRLPRKVTACTGRGSRVLPVSADFSHHTGCKCLTLFSTFRYNPIGANPHESGDSIRTVMGV